VFYRDELEALSAQDPSVSITYAYTRVTPKHWPRRAGRIDAALIAETAWPANLSPTCYLCGPTSFVETATGLLIAAGIGGDMIKTERFGPTGDRWFCWLTLAFTNLTAIQVNAREGKTWQIPFWSPERRAASAG